MTWRGTTENGAIIVTNGDRELSALTNASTPQIIATLIADTLNALERADYWQDVADALHNVGYDGP